MTSPTIHNQHSSDANTSAISQRRRNRALFLGALGVVFGDIGTSPLYAMRECFSGSHGIAPTSENVLGVLSLITWALLIEVTFKYLLWVMRADNRGEGGVLALMALAAHPQHRMRRTDKRHYLILLGLFGAALLYGGGIITPAISVLSAVEGLAIASPWFDKYLLGITCLILFALFYIQRKGTAKIGAYFGPIIMVWFLSIGALGLNSFLTRPSVIEAINPLHGLTFLFNNGLFGFAVLGSVFLVATGGEALYADMGHFGRSPIRKGWFRVALPALLLNYYGQGALLINTPQAASNPFYLLAPRVLLYPLIGIATMATVIASQALISGAFSLTRQAVQLGCFPRMAILHTSSEEIGQIYVPLVNRGLLLMTILFVLIFRTSSAMAAAYGIAVSTTMIITTFLTYFVTREAWGWSRPTALLVAGIFGSVDLVFFAANVVKIHHGGWVPIVIGAVIFTAMSTWRRGRQILARRLKAQSAPIVRFIDEVKERRPYRVPGTAIFMTGNIDGTPPALVHNLKHNKVLHETVVLLMVIIEEVPHFPALERVQSERLEENFYRVTIHFGFMEEPNVPSILNNATEFGIDFDISNITYFLGRETVLATEAEGMAIWREKLFAFMSRNSERATVYYGIPSEQVIEIGLQIEL